MEKCSFQIFSRKFIVFLYLFFYFIGCATAQSSKEEPVLKTQGPIPVFRGIQVVEKPDSVTYFELPDTLDDIDPESISTFKIKIKNKQLIEDLLKIVRVGAFAYTPEKSKRCLPAYSYAIIFRKGGKTSTILFSAACSILKIREENLYLNFDKEKEQIEKLFMEIRK